MDNQEIILKELKRNWASLLCKFNQLYFTSKNEDGKEVILAYEKFRACLKHQSYLFQPHNFLKIALMFDSIFSDLNLSRNINEIIHFKIENRKELLKKLMKIAETLADDQTNNFPPIIQPNYLLHVGLIRDVVESIVGEIDFEKKMESIPLIGELENQILMLKGEFTDTELKQLQEFIDMAKKEVKRFRRTTSIHVLELFLSELKNQELFQIKERKKQEEEEYDQKLKVDIRIERHTSYVLHELTEKWIKGFKKYLEKDEVEEFEELVNSIIEKLSTGFSVKYQYELDRIVKNIQYKLKGIKQLQDAMKVEKIEQHEDENVDEIEKKGSAVEMAYPWRIFEKEDFLNNLEHEEKVQNHNDLIKYHRKDIKYEIMDLWIHLDSFRRELELRELESIRSEDDANYNYDGPYRDGPYCSACQESPCMCSDFERTSNFSY